MVVDNSLIAGRYRLDRLIGGGTTGIVYAGTDTQTGEMVAIKQLRPELTGSMPDLVERFMREGQALRRLNHPNIIKVLATIDDGSQHYIVMEYLSGGSLADLLLHQPQLPFDRVVSIGLELSDALSRAHHLSILHRDLKPANILLAGDGSPRLTDFGLARVGGLPGMTESGALLGTFQYMSPEAVENLELNERSDIWSFGVILFEMITGRRPFEGSNPFDIIYAIKNSPLPSLENFRAGIPPNLSYLVRCMLRKDNPARTSSARQVGAELEKVQKELQSGGEERSSAPRIKVVIVDDHAVVRQGLRTYIDLQPDMEVVGEGSDGAEAVQLASSLRPDIVLLDLVMPQMDGVRATAAIKAVYPQARIIILTSFGEDDRVIPAIQAGAQGYLLKNIRPEDLIQALREANQGKIQLHPDIVQKMMSFITGNAAPKQESPSTVPPRQVASPDKVLSELSRQEQQVLGWIADGMGDQEIAARLLVSPEAVEMLVGSLLDRLDVEDRDQAAAWARKYIKL